VSGFLSRIFLAFLSVFLLSALMPVSHADDGEDKAAVVQQDQADNTAEIESTVRENNQENGDKKEGGWVLTGYANLGYRLRYTYGYIDSTEEDQDIRGLLSLSIKDRERDERFKFYMLANLNLDIDGRPAGGYGPYRDVYDTYRGNFKSQVYSAYLESRCSHLNTTFTLGRQSIYRGESLDFDGLHAEYRASKNLNFSLYGGIPSNFWESSHKGDSFAGGGVEAGTPKKFSLRCDYVHIRDKKTYEPGEPVAKDDLVILSGKYLVLKPFSLYGLYSRLEGKERRALVRAKWADAKHGLLVSATFLRQNVTLMDYSTELSPYHVVLAEYAPYYRYKAMALKELGEHLSIEAGIDIRKLQDDADEGMLNHSYEKFYSSVHLVKLLDNKMDVSVSVEKWNASGHYDKTAIEGMVKVRVSPELKVRFGSDFSKYKYDYNLQQERENVSGFFARADYKFSPAASLRFKYSLERDEREVFNLLEFSLILSW